LNKDPEKRLGAIGGMREILGHAFFRKLELSQMIARRVKPPMKPEPLADNFDESESEKGEQQLR
jgi:serum/glucocorticoid-regulated kinase 2